MRRWLDRLLSWRRPPPRGQEAEIRPSAGARAEEAAAEALRRLGYRVRGRNVRFRFGELDLVCEQQGVLVFVEVKARSRADHGHPLEAVTPRKQQQLGKLARAYLQRVRQRPPPVCRFDVVAVELGPDGEPVRVEVVPDAFQVDARPAGRDLRRSRR